MWCRSATGSRAALLLGSALMFMLVLAYPAGADVDMAACNNASSAQTCYLGTGYRGYIEINSGTLAGTTPVHEWCAKAEAAGGTIKAGSGCNPNAVSRTSCLDNVSPNSAGYAYWDGSGPNLLVVVQGRTPASSAC
jgi:hypothetical protein